MVEFLEDSFSFGEEINVGPSTGFSEAEVLSLCHFLPSARWRIGVVEVPIGGNYWFKVANFLSLSSENFRRQY